MTRHRKFKDGKQTTFGELEIGEFFSPIKARQVIAMKNEKATQPISEIVFEDTLDDMMEDDPDLTPETLVTWNTDIIAPNWWFEEFEDDEQVIRLEPSSEEQVAKIEQMRASVLAAAKAAREGK